MLSRINNFINILRGLQYTPRSILLNNMQYDRFMKECSDGATMDVRFPIARYQNIPVYHKIGGKLYEKLEDDIVINSDTGYFRESDFKT